jgi:hypothetical protein
MSEMWSKRNTKIACILCLVLTFIIVGTHYIIANPETEEVKAFINRKIDIFVNEEVKTMTDASGNEVHPIIYNGTTYVPIRGVSQVLNMDVEWDSNTGNVYLYSDGYVRKTGVDLVSQLTKKHTNYAGVLEDESLRTVNVNGANVIHSNGIECRIVGNPSIQYREYLSVPVKSGLTKVTFKAFSESNSSINLFNQQGKLVKTFYVKPNNLQEFSIDIDSNVTSELFFVALSQSGVDEVKSMKILDIYGF